MTCTMQKEAKSKLEQDELLQELYKQMFIVAYSKLRNKSDALDAVQESWIKILRKIDTLKDKDKLFQWSKVIVANTAINIWKKKQSLREVYVQDIDFQFHYEEKMDKHLVAADVKSSLDHLDQDTRLMFVYKFYFGWKDQQIADKLGFPVGTVKARLHRGKGRLRKILNAYG